VRVDPAHSTQAVIKPLTLVLSPYPRGEARNGKPKVVHGEVSSGWGRGVSILARHRSEEIRSSGYVFLGGIMSSTI
jgi:hypothetical protein